MNEPHQHVRNVSETQKALLIDRELSREFSAKRFHVCGLVQSSISEGRFAPSTGERSAQAVKACGGARRRAAPSEGIAA